MKKMNVLIPTDFSNVGNTAFKFAAGLLKQMGGKATPLFVYYEDSNIASLFDMNLVGEHPRFSEKLKKRLSDTALKDLKEDQLNEPMVRKGRAAQEIIRAAADFDLILMATNARTGMDRIMQGSTAQKVVSSTPVPVVVLTEKSKFFPVSRLLILTDLSDKSTRVFEHARRFIDSTGAPADLVYFQSVGPFSVGNRNENSEKAKQRLLAYQKQYFSGCEPQVNVQVLMTSTSATEAITNLTFSRDYSLVFLTSLGSTSFKNLMIGSTAANLLNLVDSGLYIVNP